MRYFLYCRKSTEDEERQVLSLASQQEALSRAFGADANIEITAVFEESKSAKTPGRPVFAEMLARLEAGEADGIASWAPDRLARNSVDGGHIIYLLDTGRLRDLKFATYTFENNSQGKFMLSIMFGQSKYYSDALSENVKRGNRSKLERGWRPNRAPLGYVNDPATKTIIPDPVHFPLVRRVFELYLTESMSPRQIALLARDSWGFRTPPKKRSGGKPIALGTIYRMLGNAFYAGDILWGGQRFRGAHSPVVSREEFARVQQLLKRKGLPRPQKHRFAFTGLVRCGSCGMMVTAETKTNKYGSIYTYYHCTRRGLAPRCRERSLSGEAMLRAFADFVATLIIHPDIEEWVTKRLRAETEQMVATNRLAKASCQTALHAINKQLQELRGLRLRQLLDDDEFSAERNRLLGERAVLEQADRTPPINRFELFAYMISFSKYATSWFKDSDADTQRFILNIVGSNFTLTGQKLSGKATKPFRIDPEIAKFRILCGVVEDVRENGATAVPGDYLCGVVEDVRENGATTVACEASPGKGGDHRPHIEAQGKRLLKDIKDSLDIPATADLLRNLKTLHQMMGVAVDALLPDVQAFGDTGPASPARFPVPDRGRSPRSGNGDTPR